jgi:hypothetical protein
MKLKNLGLLGYLFAFAVLFSTDALFASNFTCSRCADYNWESGNYAYSRYTLYYKGAYHSQSGKFDQPGKCEKAQSSDSRCSTDSSAPAEKFTCDSSCTYHQSAPGFFPIYFYRVFYGKKLYDKVIFNHHEKGKCLEARDNDSRCSK